jgi:SNF2 family DNA or RNA helicase
VSRNRLEREREKSVSAENCSVPDWQVVSFMFFQEHKVLLTGTPLQNTVEELFSLLHFLEPSRFPSETTFMQEFGDLKTEEQVLDPSELPFSHETEDELVKWPRFLVFANCKK